MRKADTKTGEVTREERTYSNDYTGTKEALIAWGCDAQWFRDEASRTNSRGRVTRRYRAKAGKGSVHMRDNADGTWTVSMGIPQKEQQRRRQAAIEHYGLQDHPQIRAQRELAARLAPVPGAIFPEGARITLWLPGAEHHMAQGVVVAGYGLHARNSRDGKPGAAWGYYIRFDGDDNRYFADPWMVRDLAYKPKHIRLVVDNAAQSRA